MRLIACLTGLALCLTLTGSASAGGILEHTMKDIDGKEVNLAETYKGKVLLIVNVASKCGLTPQYKELEALHQKYKDKGLVILGFPANDFKGQEPGTDAQIKEFCSTKYNVSFPLFSKICVKGDGMHPLYKSLSEAAGDKAPEWNFSKYLVNKAGEKVMKFPSRMKPDAKELTEAIEKLLAE